MQSPLDILRQRESEWTRTWENSNRPLQVLRERNARLALRRTRQAVIHLLRRSAAR
jgi:hypothetical protein